MVDRNFHKVENGLSRQVGLSRGVVQNRFQCTASNGSVPMKITSCIANILDVWNEFKRVY